MARPPTPPPKAELAAVARAAAVLADLEQQAEKARADRNAAMLAAKHAGATVEQIAAAAGMARQNAHTALKAAGYDPGSF